MNTKTDLREQMIDTLLSLMDIMVAHHDVTRVQLSVTTASYRTYRIELDLP